jgi:hypothetical protein
VAGEAEEVKETRQSLQECPLRTEIDQDGCARESGSSGGGGSMAVVAGGWRLHVLATWGAPALRAGLPKKRTGSLFRIVRPSALLIVGPLSDFWCHLALQVLRNFLYYFFDVSKICNLGKFVKIILPPVW